LAAALEAEADGFLGVVRDAEAGDFEVAVGEARASLEVHPVRAVFELGLDGAGCGRVGVEPDVRVLAQSVEPRAVVAVFVGDENGVDSLEREGGVGGEELAEAACGEPSVDEHGRTRRLE